MLTDQGQRQMTSKECMGSRMLLRQFQMNPYTQPELAECQEHMS
jgi:hypothetical protein